MWHCPDCGGKRCTAAMWVGVNDSFVHGETGAGYYCPDCDQEKRTLDWRDAAEGN